MEKKARLQQFSVHFVNDAYPFPTKHVDGTNEGWGIYQKEWQDKIAARFGLDNQGGAYGLFCSFSIRGDMLPIVETLKQEFPEMQLFVPEIGDTLTLTEDWTFELFDEARNETTLMALGLIPQDANRWSRDRGDGVFAVTLNAGIVWGIYD